MKKRTQGIVVFVFSVSGENTLLRQSEPAMEAHRVIHGEPGMPPAQQGLGEALRDEIQLLGARRYARFLFDVTSM
jgi:hypothetical protein